MWQNSVILATYLIPFTFIVQLYFIRLLLLLQLAHHPTKDSGTIQGICGKGNFTINMDFKKHPQGQPLLVPDSTPQCVYPVRP